MESFIRLVGRNRAVEIFGIRLVGFNAENGGKLLFTLTFIALVLLAGHLLRSFASRLFRGPDERVAFWTRQGISLASLRITVSASSGTA